MTEAVANLTTQPLEVVRKVRKNNPEKTRESILQAAITEFVQQGLSGARVDAIAARVPLRPWERLEPRLHALVACMEADDMLGLRQCLLDLVDGFAPTDEVLDWRLLALKPRVGPVHEQRPNPPDQPQNSRYLLQTDL